MLKILRQATTDLAKPICIQEILSATPDQAVLDGLDWQEIGQVVADVTVTMSVTEMEDIANIKNVPAVC